jgi:hypothetical protein
LKSLVGRGWIPLGPGDGLPEVIPWTDDHINILSPLWESARERWASFSFPAWVKSIWPFSR